MIRCLLACLVAAVLTAADAPWPWPDEHPVRYPADAGIIDVTRPPYNAAGDGIADDTDAIQRAIWDHVGKTYRHAAARTIYLPAGTYRITRPLEARHHPESDDHRAGAWQAFCVIQGEHSATTTIRLDDTCPGFGDPAAPRAVLTTASDRNTDRPGDRGAGNAGFRNTVANLTIDVGSGNPGAIAIDYHVNNVGRLEHLVLRAGADSGYAALGLRRSDLGPGLLHALRIEGFARGLWCAGWSLGLTGEYLQLRGQREVGILIEDTTQSMLALRRVHSVNAVPALRQQDSRSLVCLTEARLEGAQGGTAIELASHALLEDVTAAGYTDAVRAADGERIVAGTIHEWSSATARHLDGDAPARLPVAEVPAQAPSDPATWASVVAFGADPSDEADDTAAIQAALDSGADTVYFPVLADRRGGYRIGRTITVPGHVRRVVGLHNELRAITDPANHPYPDDAWTALRILGDDPDALTVIDGLTIKEVPWGLRRLVAVEHAAAGSVLLREVQIPSYRNRTGAGPVFFQGVTGHATVADFRFVRQRAWLRQFNPEDRHQLQILNDGSALWIYGFKMESLGPLLRAAAGSTTELLGAKFPATVPAPAGVPLVALHDRSALRLSGIHFAWDEDGSGRKSFDILLDRHRDDGSVDRLHADGGVPRLARPERELDRRAWIMPLLTAGHGHADGVAPALPRLQRHADDLALAPVDRPRPVTASWIRYGADGAELDRGERRLAAGTEAVPLGVEPPQGGRIEVALDADDGMTGYPRRLAMAGPVAITGASDIPDGAGLWVRGDGPWQLTTGAGVERWRDRSGNGRDLYFPSDAHHPRWQAAAVGARPGLVFDGHWLFAPPERGFTAGGPFPRRSLALVFRTADQVDTIQTLWDFNQGGSSLNVYLEDGQLYVHQGEHCWLRTPVVAATDYALTLVLDVEGSGLSAWLNGSVIGTHPLVRALHGQDQLPFGLGDYTVGSGFHGTGFVSGRNRMHGGYDFPGAIAELIDWPRALDAAELERLHAYLARRYDLAELDVAPFRPRINLLANPSFERGGGDWGWHGQAEASRVGDRDHRQHGGASLRLTATGAHQPGIYRFLIQEPQVEPNTRYRLSLQARGRGIATIADHGATAAWFGGGPGWSQRVHFPAGDFDWRGFELEFTTGAEGGTWPVMVLLEGPVGGLWLDDVELVAVGDAP